MHAIRRFCMQIEWKCFERGKPSENFCIDENKFWKMLYSKYVLGPAGQSTPPRGDIGRLRSSFGLRPGKISFQYTVQSTTWRHLLTLDVCGPLSVLRPGKISFQYTVQSTTWRHLLTLDVCGPLSVLRPGKISFQYTVQSTTRRHMLTVDVCGPLSVFVQVTSLLNILYNPPPDVTCWC